MCSTPIGCRPSSRVEGPPIVDWKSTHPLLRYVGFDNVQVAAANVAKAPSWAVPLVDSPQASLILAGEIGRQRSDLGRLRSPGKQLAIAHFVPDLHRQRRGMAQSRQCRPRPQPHLRRATPTAFRLLQPEPSATVTYPGGATRTLPLDATANEFVFGDTARSGIYRVRLGTNETAFCVNLLNAAESNIRPRDELQFGAYTKVVATTLRRANLELWRTIAAIGLLVLLFEWWYYHRRTA